MIPEAPTVSEADASDVVGDTHRGIGFVLGGFIRA
jgi:hypothetical protein